MEVILLEKVKNVGGIGDRVRVKSGFARNFLIPQGKATLATSANIEKFEARRAELKAQAATEGKLFGSIGTVDIAEACGKLGVPVERSEVRMHEGPLRVIGEHKVELHLHADVNVELTVIVESEEQQAA